MIEIAFCHLNELSENEFVTVLRDVFEHSPWVAERVADQRPFKSIRALHAAMAKTVADASEREQTELIDSHPDLAGRAALAGELTDASTDEQSEAGLDRLSEDELKLFVDLNEQYRSKFGIPFILAVKGHDKESIFAAYPSRIENSDDEERREALRQIVEIARYRLEAMLHHEADEQDIDA